MESWHDRIVETEFVSACRGVVAEHSLFSGAMKSMMTVRNLGQPWRAGTMLDVMGCC
jgi:hypothetical protein